MEKFNCLIVEDEPLAVEILLDYINQIPFLVCNHIANDALQAAEELKSNKIDLIFLDINMPKIKGIDFLRSLNNPPQVIITTAYRDFAIEGFDLNAVDYLLKPISFNRFLTAVNKLKNPDKKLLIDSPNSNNNTEKDFVFININKKRVKLLLEDIIFIESRKEYINIVTKDKSFLTKHQLTEIENLLDKRRFLRIHRCYIVAINKIKAYDATEVELTNIQLPVGRSYKELIYTVLNNVL